MEKEKHRQTNGNGNRYKERWFSPDQTGGSPGQTVQPEHQADQQSGQRQSAASQPPHPVLLQIKRVLRAQENYSRTEKKVGVVEEDLVAGIVSVLEELHKLLKAPHQQIVFWENRLHQALLQSHAARVKMTGSVNGRILMPDY